jgi:hypothetical protein
VEHNNTSSSKGFYRSTAKSSHEEEATALNEHKYTFVEPGRARRRRMDELKQVLKDDPGLERARVLAELAHSFHDNREINLALDTARQSLEDSGGLVEFLLDAYICHTRMDQLIDDLSMLESLGRWLQNEALMTAVRAQAYERALAWCGTTDGRERERRIDTLRRRFDDSFANEIDLALL